MASTSHIEHRQAPMSNTPTSPCPVDNDGIGPVRWAQSIDRVYSLFEDPDIAAQNPTLSNRVRTATQLTEEVVRDLGPARIALSFNGGKDCTVLAHILAAVLRRLGGLSSPLQATPQGTCILPVDAIYIQCPAPFPEVEDFIRVSAKRYNMDVRCIKGDMKTALTTFLHGHGSVFASCPAEAAKGSTPPGPDAPDQTTPFSQSSKPEVQSPNGPLLPNQKVTAIFIGTRSTDPNGGGLAQRAWTDPGWPQVERIHPVLDWEYRDIWDFLRCPHLTAFGSDDRSPGVPYCSLYNEGYTSLGSTFNTFPNPELKCPETAQDGKPVYGPAYLLASGALERCGRGTAQP